MINLSTFLQVSGTASLSPMTSLGGNPFVGLNAQLADLIRTTDNKILIHSSSLQGNDSSKTFCKIDPVQLASTFPTISGITFYQNALSYNTHNSMTYDPVNNRLIFTGCAIGSAKTYYPTEIVNIP